MQRQPLTRILYAEDEKDIRAIAQIALEDIGHFTVEYCGTGREVLEKVNRFHPDLFLIDVMMPEMDGLTALKELRKQGDFVNIPAILMTAKIQPEELEEYRKMGVLDVIPKPFDPMKLVDKINQVWTKYHG